MKYRIEVNKNSDLCILNKLDLKNDIKIKKNTVKIPICKINNQKYKNICEIA